MKKIVLLIIAAFCAASIMMTSCNQNSKNEVKAVENDSIENDSTAKDSLLTAIEKYLIDGIGKQYSQGDMCIPSVSLVNVNQENPDSVMVLGSFWVYNYKQVGDTLKTVSGGSHPGMMHLRKTASGYEVTGFDCVADGADNLKSAKEIFGDHFDAFQALESNDKKRDEIRTQFIADYVKLHNLSVTMYQDYGWDPIQIKADSIAQ